MYLPTAYFKYDRSKEAALLQHQKQIEIDKKVLELFGLTYIDGTFEYLESTTDNLHCVSFQNSELELNDKQREHFNAFLEECRNRVREEKLIDMQTIWD